MMEASNTVPGGRRAAKVARMLISRNSSLTRCPSGCRARAARPWTMVMAMVILISCFCSVASAQLLIPNELVDAKPVAAVVDDVPAVEGSASSQSTISGTILVDPAVVLESGELRKRQTPSTTTSASDASTTVVVVASPLPSVFDTALGAANFTTKGCADYMKTFIASSEFKACLPFSMLEMNSNSFFQASKSVVRITQVLDASCAANVASCTTLLTNLASNLTTAANCAADLRAGVPIVNQAYLGLVSYRPLYTASCTRNPATSAYCFADAITNASSPSDAYPYLLPLNVSMFGGSQPTCNTCLQSIMGVFSSAAANRSQVISATYPPAAQQINVRCGPGFVNATLPNAVVSGAAGMAGASVGAVVLALGMVAVLV